jgi:Flp pilus assembly protein TadB
MMEEPLKRQWWLAVVAAVLAAFVVYDAVGLTAGIALLVLTLAGIGVYRYARARKFPQTAAVYCLNCGQKLPATARQCNECGSASWSYKN